MNPLPISSPLQSTPRSEPALSLTGGRGQALMAPASSFVRHCNYSYPSSQELLSGTHQAGFHYEEEMGNGFYARP